jgi:hypothetical protein
MISHYLRENLLPISLSLSLSQKCFFLTDRHRGIVFTDLSLISMFVFYILQIPSGCSRFLVGTVHPLRDRWQRPATNSLMRFVFMPLGAALPICLTELILTSVHMGYSVTSDRVRLTDTVASVTCTRSSVFFSGLVKENSRYAVNYIWKDGHSPMISVAYCYRLLLFSETGLWYGTIFHFH